MRFPIKISLGHNVVKAKMFHQTWNLTDRFFRFSQWIAFTAVVKYAADKSNILMLDVFSFILQIMLSVNIYLMIESKYEVLIYGINEKSRIQKELHILFDAIIFGISVTTINRFVEIIVAIFVKSTHM